MLSCLTMLSCPRRGSGNLKDRKITQHASHLILHSPSILFHAQRGTLAKKCSHELMLSGPSPSTYQQQFTKFNSLMVDWHYCFHLPWGHSTQLKFWAITHAWFWMKIVQQVFGTFSLFPYMVLFTSINIQNKFLKNSQKPWLGNPFGIRRNSAIIPIPDLLNSGIFIGILFFRS